MDQYSQNQEFQTKILGLCWRDPVFLHRYSDVLDPRYFSFEILGLLMRLTLDYYAEYRVPPTKTAIETLAEEYIFRNRLVIERERIMNTISYCFSVDLSDGILVRDRVVSFGRTMALKVKLAEAIDIINSGDENRFEEIPTMLHQALATGMSLGNDDFDFNEFLRDPISYLRRYRAYDNAYRVTTPWPTINGCMQGGLGPGQILVIMAGSGIGKSIALINLAHHVASRERRPVYYFPIGDLKEPDIGLRYLCLLFQIEEEHILKNSNPELLAAKIQEFSRYTHPLEICYFSPATVTVQTLRSYITKKIATSRGERRPALIIVDYADNLLAIRNRGKGTYLELGSIYEDLITLGDDFSCPVATATQPQRWGLSDDLLDIEKVGDSRRKMEHADYVITINQSAKEKMENLCRVYVAKSRRGPSKESLSFILNPSKMLLQELGRR